MPDMNPYSVALASVVKCFTNEPPKNLDHSVHLERSNIQLSYVRSSNPNFYQCFGSAQVFMPIRIQDPKNVLMDPDPDPDP